jgi:hypothetical protein
MNDFKKFWDTKCSHGYSKRKNCPRCHKQSSEAAKYAANTRWGNVPQRSR